MPSYNPAVVTDAIRQHVDEVGHGAQTRMARGLGVAVQTVNKWVKGQTVPETWRWPAIEQYLGLPKGDLSERAGLVAQPTPDLAALYAELDALRERVRSLEEDRSPPQPETPNRGGR